MIKRFMILIIALLLLLLTIGCNMRTEAQGQASVDVDWQFYKVVKGNHHMYLLGTMHVGKKEMYPFPNGILQAMEESNYLVTEVDWTNLIKGETEQAIANDILLPDGVVLDDLLSEDAKQHLTHLSKDYNFAYEAYQNYRPWYVARIISNKFIASSGLSGKYGVDNQVYELAKKLKMDFKALEESSFPMKLLQKANPDEQADHIIKSLPSKNEGKAGTVQLLDAYINGKAAEFVLQQMSEVEQDLMLRVRNESWLPQLEQFVQSGEVHFVAVGDGHLTGKYGLLKDLEAKGYTISKIE